MQLVAPPGGGSGVFQGHGQHMAHMVLLDEMPLLVSQVPVLRAAFREGLASIGAGEGPVGLGGDHLMGRVEHQPRDLLHREPAGQVPGPVFRVKPPVLIGQQLSGSGQVLKVEPVHLQHICPSGADLRPVRVLIDLVSGGVFVFHSNLSPFGEI